MKLKSIIIVGFILLFAVTSCQNKTKPVAKVEKPLVTFIELGSVRCIPCQKMQSVMKSVETKFGPQVKVVFYDVWTEAGKPYAKTYKINLIPTQVFLDKNGKEYFRHEGYFPEEDLIKILNKQGVKESL
jgi:thioredoxin 1